MNSSSVQRLAAETARLAAPVSLDASIFNLSVNDEGEGAAMILDADGDLLVEVQEKVKVEKQCEKDGNISKWLETKTQIQVFRVNRQLLTRSSAYFERMFKQHQPAMIKLTEVTITSMELWLRHIHRIMTPEMNVISTLEMWNVIAAGVKYSFLTEQLEDWFATWFEIMKADWIQLKDDDKNKYIWLTKMLYPTYFFSHVAGFLFVTKKAVYMSPYYIEEFNPTNNRNLKLPHRIAKQLNDAKGTMRNNIHKTIFGVIPNFHRESVVIKKPIPLEPGTQESEGAIEQINGSKEKEKHNHIYHSYRIKQPRTDPCRIAASYNYEAGLLDTGIYPLQSYRNSIDEVVEGLAKFSYIPPEGACEKCNTDFRSTVIMEIMDKTVEYFDGLCLDCINTSKDKDYKSWIFDRRHHYGKGRSHGEPTTYFSFMGREETRNAHEAEREKRKRGLGYTGSD